MSVGGSHAGYAVPHFRGLGSVLAAVILLSCPTLAVAVGAEQPKLVVVLYPEDSSGSPGAVAIDRGVRSTFAADSPGDVLVRNEFVDVSRTTDPESKRLQREYLRRKYTGQKVDLVIAVLSSALEFALTHRAEIFPGVPVIFAAIDQRQLEALNPPPGVIGVPMRVDLAGTLDIALRLHPGTRRVFVVVGSASYDAFWDAEARRTFRPYEDRLEFVYLSGLPMADLLERVANLPEQSVIYHIHLHEDGSGKSFVPVDVLGILSRRANAPIYGHIDTHVGRGIVGGRVISVENQGKNAARLGLRILAGERPESIPVPEVSENTDLFDWRQLRRWGVTEQSLPPGSVVLFQEPTFWDTYKWRIIGVVSLCLVEALLIAGLLFQLVKRRRAEARFRQVIETAPTGMLMVGRDGTIHMANAQVEKLFGYRKEELLGQPVELLVPEWLRGQHPTDRERFFTAPDVRPMGFERDLLARRKDGSEFPVEIGLRPLRTPRGPFVLASVIDLTQRRRAEDGLRESQRELQLLTGRLLEAQEAERRRIARELHDDVNQSLALLAVEMDLLAGSPPESRANTADRMRELSTRLKELSSSVHDLSHQLHPSKLEQLGLVATVHGLCKELSQSHGLDVKFTHYPESRVVPQDAGLCLYRIVQEALQNVVKHSGSRHAAIELWSTAGAICLRVVDDGIGFDPDAAGRNGGLGLVGMRERLYLVGGAIAIDSRPSGGTRIDVRVPLPAADRSEAALQTGVSRG